MRKTLLAAMMAASALVPAAAMAQDNGEKPHGEGRPQQQHQGAPGGGHAQPQRAASGGGQPQPQQVRAPQAPQQQQMQARIGARPQGQAPLQADAGGVRGERGDRGDRGNRPAFQGGRPDFRGPPSAQAQAPLAQERQQGRGFDGRRPDGRPEFNRGTGGGRPDYTHDQRDGRPDFNQRQQRPDVNERGGRANFDQRNDNHRWSRDWRHDNRYNYSFYRDQNRGAYHLPRYYAPHGWDYGYRRFSVGFRLNSILFGENYWIGDADYYRLPPAYGPYRWVRYYNDALLIDIRTGYVVDTVYDIFW